MPSLKYLNWTFALTTVLILFLSRWQEKPELNVLSRFLPSLTTLWHFPLLSLPFSLHFLSLGLPCCPFLFPPNFSLIFHSFVSVFFFFFSWTPLLSLLALFLYFVLTLPIFISSHDLIYVQDFYRDQFQISVFHLYHSPKLCNQATCPFGWWKRTLKPTCPSADNHLREPSHNSSPATLSSPLLFWTNNNIVFVTNPETVESSLTYLSPFKTYV